VIQPQAGEPAKERILVAPRRSPSVAIQVVHVA